MTKCICGGRRDRGYHPPGAGVIFDRVDDGVPQAGQRLGLLVGLGRELHALKGAGRMMGFAEIADLCHRAEDLLAEASPDRRAGLEPGRSHAPGDPSRQVPGPHRPDLDRHAGGID